MKLIGIMGKSGSGKTTLSRMLKKNNDIAVIHLDGITNNRLITKRMPKWMAQDYTNNIGEEKIRFNRKIIKLIYLIKSNKFLGEIYLDILRIPRESNIKKQINEFKNEGKKCIIIERYYIGLTSNI